VGVGVGRAWAGSPQEGSAAPERSAGRGVGRLPAQGDRALPSGGGAEGGGDGDRPLPTGGEAEWPLPTEPPLRLALHRLMGLGTEWAKRRGGQWDTVLNAGPPGVLHPFRWQVVATAIAFAAGRVELPPADYTALPVGLQAFLAWAIPAALADTPPPAVHLASSRAALALAEGLAAELAGPATPPEPTRPPRPPRSGTDAGAPLAAAPPSPGTPPGADAGAPLAAAPSGPGTPPDADAGAPLGAAPPGPGTPPDADAGAPLAAAPPGPGAPPGPQTVAPLAAAPPAPGTPPDPDADTGALLAAALAAPSPAPLPAAAVELLARLREGPLPLAKLRALAAAHGSLPGTLLDALDAAAQRVLGAPATRLAGATLDLSPEYKAAVAAGEDPLG